MINSDLILKEISETQSARECNLIEFSNNDQLNRFKLYEVINNYKKEEEQLKKELKELEKIQENAETNLTGFYILSVIASCTISCFCLPLFPQSFGISFLCTSGLAFSILLASWGLLSVMSKKNYKRETRISSLKEVIKKNQKKINNYEIELGKINKNTLLYDTEITQDNKTREPKLEQIGSDETIKNIDKLNFNEFSASLELDPAKSFLNNPKVRGSIDNAIVKYIENNKDILKYISVSQIVNIANSAVLEQLNVKENLEQYNNLLLNPLQQNVETSDKNAILVKTK